MKRLVVWLLVCFSAPGLALAQTAPSDPVVRDVLARLVTVLQQLIEKLETTANRVLPTSTEPSAPVARKPLKIDDLSPRQGPVGTEIMIRGRGFDRVGNTIYTGYGPQTASSPDGETITFVFSPPAVPGDLGQRKTDEFPPLPFGIYVKNQKGEVAGPAVFTFIP